MSTTFVQAPPYVPKNKIRVVTAASLFDGHDAAINIMRRIIQSTGAEVIHLGHDRSVEDVVNTAIQEDAHAIAMTSYPFTLNLRDDVSLAGSYGIAAAVFVVSVLLAEWMRRTGQRGPLEVLLRRMSYPSATAQPAA